MYLADCHTHTCCSNDSQAPLAEMAAAAHNCGVTHLCTTDHCDLMDLDGNPVHTLDWTPILAQYGAVRAALPAGLELALGLELGSAQAAPDRARAIVSGAPLDFVIGSVHNLSPERGGRDFYFLEYETPQACHQALEDYFASMLALAPLVHYDSLGHIIYPLRYMNGRAGHHITLERYQDQIKQLLKLVVETGHSIEVNTHCGREVEDWRPILRQYRALGGELVTLGSDAHTPGDVGKGIAQAQELLRETGFRYFSVYRQRKPEWIKL